MTIGAPAVAFFVSAGAFPQSLAKKEGKPWIE